jgi:hypothetical protein
LGEVAAKRPVLFRGLEKVYKHLLREDAGAFVEQLRDTPACRAVGCFRSAVRG